VLPPLAAVSAKRKLRADVAHPAPSSPQSNLGARPRERIRSSPPPRRIPVNHTPKELPEVRQALESFCKSGGLASSPSTPGATPSFIELLKNRRANTTQGLRDLDSIRGSLKAA
jgi:hypothetical protein